MENILQFNPGYEAEEYGTHPLEIHIGVRNENAALIFTVCTGMYPDGSSTTPYFWATLHQHVLDPHFREEDLTPVCNWLNGEPCISTTPWGFTGPKLKEFYRIFILEGPEALQAALADELRRLT